MVSFSAVASLASIVIAAGNRSEASDQQAAAQRVASGEETDESVREALSAEQEMQNATNEKLDTLIDIQQKNQPTTNDKDAFSSAVIELGNGDTADVVVEPASGWNLRVKRVHFDRRDDHIYEINVGGKVTSVGHRAMYQSPRRVSQSDRVVATVTNESGSSSVIDFEMEAWAERPPSDGVV